MSHIMKKIFFLLLLTLSTSPVSSEPSFDFRKAKTEVEKQICASEILSVLDVKLASRYRKLKNLYRGVKKSQRAWQKQRDTSCGSTPSSDERENCLIRTYGFQLAELEIITKQDTSQKLMAICRDIATSYYAGNTYQMREGGRLTITCLEGVLDSLGQKKIAHEQWSDLVRKAGSAVGELDWVINNDRKSCAGSCGTMYHLFHNATVIEFYEGVIKKMYQLDND